VDENDVLDISLRRLKHRETAGFMLLPHHLREDDTYFVTEYLVCNQMHKFKVMHTCL